MVEIFGMSDVGCVRELNEDCFCIHGFESGEEKGVCILADGMGGHNAGEVASQNAVRFINDRMRRVLDGELCEPIPAALNEAIEQANERVFKMSIGSSAHSGMGTTVVAAYIENGSLYIANVGDSRAYLKTAEGYLKLTRDHSVVEELVRSGMITEEEARVHPQRNIITRAVGTELTVDADIFDYEYSPGDVLILCSDGLSSMVDDKETEKIIMEEKTSENTVCKLIDAAKKNGGLDNITVICIRFK